MDELIKTTSESIDKYFKSLHQFGYINYNKVYNILTATYLIKMFDTYSNYITEADYRSIVNSFYCICGKYCLIKFPKY